jgi:hypothetical protein
MVVATREEIMNKVLCTMTLILVLAAGPAADGRDLWFGVRGGPSIPNLSGGGNEVSEGYSSIVAPNFGLVADYFLTDHISIKMEADYSVQGGERNGLQPITQALPGLPALPPGQYLYADFRNKSVLDYIEIPVMAKYQGGVSKNWRYFVQAGPYIGFLLNAEQETRGTSLIYADKNGTPLTLGGQPLPPVSFDANTDVKNRLNDVNAGITAGVGLAYLIGEHHQVFLDIRGQYGLIPLQKDTDTDGESHAGCVVFSLGYMFHFGG